MADGEKIAIRIRSSSDRYRGEITFGSAWIGG